MVPNLNYERNIKGFGRLFKFMSQKTTFLPIKGGKQNLNFPVRGVREQNKVGNRWFKVISKIKTGNT